MITATPEGKDLFILDPSGHTSHFIWRDAEHILAWTQPEGRPARFYLFEDKTRQVEVVGENVMTGNGHCSYLPGNEWILNDTYPDKEGKQHVYLYHVASQKKVLLGSFFAPPEYRGEWRCDTHPRFSPDGRSVVIDSAHGGNGRQMYLIDITRILA
jgi:Tol biopolymer transport system component